MTTRVARCYVATVGCYTVSFPVTVTEIFPGQTALTIFQRILHSKTKHIMSTQRAVALGAYRNLLKAQKQTFGGKHRSKR